MQSQTQKAENDTKQSRQALRECEVDKAVIQERLDSNLILVQKIRQKTLKQNQMLVDMQRAFKGVLGELAISRRETEALKKRQEIVSQEFTALFQSQGSLTQSRLTELIAHEHERSTTRQELENLRQKADENERLREELGVKEN